MKLFESAVVAAVFAAIIVFRIYHNKPQMLTSSSAPDSILLMASRETKVDDGHSAVAAYGMLSTMFPCASWHRAFLVDRSELGASEFECPGVGQGVMKTVHSTGIVEIMQTAVRLAKTHHMHVHTVVASSEIGSAMEAEALAAVAAYARCSNVSVSFVSVASDKGLWPTVAEGNPSVSVYVAASATEANALAAWAQILYDANERVKAYPGLVEMAFRGVHCDEKL